MDNYVKGETKESTFDPRELFANERPREVLGRIPLMRVKKNSKIRNLVTFAVKYFQEEENRDIVFDGEGAASSKVVAAVEVFKREFKDELHQETHSRFRRTEELWEPQLEGLERLVVNRDVPTLTVLLSRDPLTSRKRMGGHCSYQSSKQKRVPTWLAEEKPVPSHKSHPHPAQGSNKWKRPKRDKKADPGRKKEGKNESKDDKQGT